MQPIIFRFLLNDTNAPNFDLVVQWLKDNLDQEVTINNQMGNLVMCNFYGTDITYNHIPAKHPEEFFYEGDKKNPKTALLIQSHQSQASIMAGMYDDEDFMGLVNAWRTCSLMAMAINNVSGCTAVMIDTGELLLEPEVFNHEILNKITNKETLPVSAWVSVRVGSNENGNYGYTKGIKAHGLKELEVINSQKSHDEIYGLLCDLASYTIIRHVKFKDGETFGYTEDMKIPISKVKGTYVEKKVFRLEF